MNPLLIPYMLIINRLIGWRYKNIGRALFAAGYGYVLTPDVKFADPAIMSIVAIILSVVWVFFTRGLGHQDFFSMGRPVSPRRQFLTPATVWLYEHLISRPANHDSVLYDIFGMGLKGLLINIPLIALNPLYGLLAEFSWPFSYWLGWKIAPMFKNIPKKGIFCPSSGTFWGECLTGLFTGVCLYAAV